MLMAQVDRDDCYLFSNCVYKEWFGRSPEEMRGLHVRDIVGEAAYEGRRPYFERALRASRSPSKPTDGSLRRCETHYIPHSDEAERTDGFFIVVDLEEREAKRNVALAEKRFRIAMDAVEGVLWTNNRDGRMVGVQPGWQALTGQSYEEYDGGGLAPASRATRSLKTSISLVMSQ